MLEMHKELVALTEEISKVWESIDELVEDEGCLDRGVLRKYQLQMDALMKRHEALSSRMICRESVNDYVFEQRLEGQRKEVYTRMPATDRDADKSCVDEDAVKSIARFVFETSSAICSANGAVNVGAQIMRVLEQLLQVDDDGEPS